MKKLSTYLFLLLFSFSAPSFADDISEFQIEGMSIGDSLLDYFTVDEINNDTGYYDDNKFVYSFILKHSSFKIYDSLSLAYKPNDKKYIIHSIEASIAYRYNISECYQQKENIVSELSKLFKKKSDSYNNNYSGDKSGKSKVSVTDIYLKSGTARVICYDIDEELSKNKGWWDRLSVIINNEEFGNFLENKAYN
jgi:hypothetical protein|tara:strand:+ start:564 stop:1145 length:582 start_codon:yes stop_codon:yes gene_type:complete